MEIRVLKYFLVVASEKNITKAAEKMHLTQPTLSRQLSQLEKELGVTLFERKSHSISLTREGMLLKQRAQEMVDLEEKTKKDLMRSDSSLFGIITVAGSVFRSSFTLARRMADFMKRNPLISFAWLSGNYDDIAQKLDGGLVDIGLFMDPVDLSLFETIRMPEDEKWGAFVREDSELAGRDVIRREDLAGKNLIVPNRGRLKDELTTWLGGQKTEFHIRVSCDQQNNVAELVRNGAGISLDIDLGVHYDQLKFIPLYPSLSQGTVLAWKRDRIQPPAVSAFLEYVEEMPEKHDMKYDTGIFRGADSRIK